MLSPCSTPHIGMPPFLIENKYYKLKNLNKSNPKYGKLFVMWHAILIFEHTQNREFTQDKHKPQNDGVFHQ